MNTRKVIHLTLALLVTVSADSWGITLDFEDIYTYKNFTSLIPSNYASFNWKYFYALNGKDAYPGSGYDYGATSGKNVLISFGDFPGSFSGPQFNLRSIDATSAWEEGNALTIAGYRNDAVKYLATYTLSTIAPTHISLNWVGISDFRLEAFRDKIALDTVVFDKPRVYGLFVGTKYTDGMRGDLSARLIGGALELKSHVSASYMIADESKGEGFTSSQIGSELDAIRGQMKAGDTLVLYINGHGISLGDLVSPLPSGSLSGLGREFLSTGDRSDSRYRLYDSELSEMLSKFSADQQKLSFLDGCQAGGFFKRGKIGDVSDLGLHLIDIPNSAVIAGAPEDEYSYWEALSGRSFLSKAIERTFENHLLSEMTLEDLTSEIVAETKREAIRSHAENPNLKYGISGLGGFVDADPSKVNPVFYATPDFGVGAGVLTAVPEPSRESLMVLGMLVLLLNSSRLRNGRDR